MADRAAGAARATSIDPGIVARLSGALRVLTGRAAPTDFFGPGVTPAPVAPEAAGRAFDFPTGYNLRAQPRSDEPTTFAQLRQLADMHDLTRLAIETRKDQLERAEWHLVRRDAAPGDAPQQLVDFLRDPDQEHGFGTWLRMLVEEVLVIDALTLYLRRTRGGGLYAVEQLDGATIVRKLDATGRTPLPPEVAYQQVLKGMPAVDYTREELLYVPRNPRVHRVYGYSPVEQIIVTVNLALRRQAHQLAYYDKSNVPAALVAVPKEWTPDQIKKFQDYWDLLFASEANLAHRRQMKFVPGDTKAQLLQTEPLFGEAEEWLARVVCFAFSLPPTPFVRMMNRATSETAQSTAEDEGLAPLLLYVKRIMDRLIQSPFALNAPEWEWQWKTDKPLAAEKQAVIDTQYIAAGVRTPEQVAIERFGTYEAPPAPAPAPNGPHDPNAPATTDPATPPDDEAAKAAGRALRRAHY